MNHPPRDLWNVARRRRCAGRLAPAIGLLAFWIVISSVAVSTSAEKSKAHLGPCALAVSRDGKRLYAACADARQVAWVRLPSGDVVRRVDTPAEPTGLALTPDQTQLIVTCAAPRSIVLVLDAASGRRIAEIPAGHTATSPVISPDGQRLYVCNRFDNNVSVIDLPAGAEAARAAAGREPIAAAVSPDGLTVLAANHLPNTRTDRAYRGEVAPVVTVIDARTFETAEIPLPHGANGVRGLCIAPDGKHAFVTHLLSNFEMIPFRVDMGWINVNVVSVIDMRRRKVIATIGMDRNDLGAANPYDVACALDGKNICVSLSGAHELGSIGQSDLLGDFARRTMQPMLAVWPIYLSLGTSLWRRTELPGQGPRGLAVAGSKVYAAQYFSDSIAVVDLEAPDDTPVRTIALGPPPQLTPRRRGELLFHDAKICFQQWQSCASCHPDGRVDALNWDLMNDGQGDPKNTKSLLLAHQTPPAMAEGVRSTAEAAVRAGLEHILFSQASEEDAAAIDEYLRSLRPTPSPYLVEGRLSPAAERGQALFASRRVGCGDCHPPPLYTDLHMHRVGSSNPLDRSESFDTPTLVEVWRTAPYLHDGRYTTIRQLLVEGRHGLRSGRRGELTRQEIDDLAQFVLSL